MASLEQQLRRIERQIQGNLKVGMNEVAKEVKKIQSEKVKEEVYGTYTPKQYERREDDGGLSDVRNMKHDTETLSDGGVVLEVRNETMSNEEFLPDGKQPFEIAGVVEYGQMYQGDVYDWPEGREPQNDDYKLPRSFIEATRRELVARGVHVRKLRNSLRKQGLNVD